MLLFFMYIKVVLSIKCQKILCIYDWSSLHSENDVFVQHFRLWFWPWYINESWKVNTIFKFNKSNYIKRLNHLNWTVLTIYILCDMWLSKRTYAKLLSGRLCRFNFFWPPRGMKEKTCYKKILQMKFVLRISQIP